MIYFKLKLLFIISVWYRFVFLVISTEQIDSFVEDEVDNFREFLEQKFHTRKKVFDEDSSSKNDDGLNQAAESDDYYFNEENSYTKVKQDKSLGSYDEVSQEEANNPQSLDFYKAIKAFSNSKANPDDKGELVNNQGTFRQDSVKTNSLGLEPSVEEVNPIDEIFYYRRGKSDAVDPLSDILKTLRHQESNKDAPDINEKIIKPANDIKSCSSTISSHSDQVCSSSPIHTIDLFNSTKYSRNLRKELEAKIPIRHPEDSLCEYKKLLGKDRGVNERALCPFEWKVSDHNPDRLPEYLFEADCSCQVSRGGLYHRAVCIPLKSRIPVLWRVECENNKYKYQEGWEEISVACIPIGDVDIHSKYVPSFIAKNPT